MNVVLKMKEKFRNITRHTSVTATYRKKKKKNLNCWCSQNGSVVMTAKKN